MKQSDVEWLEHRYTAVRAAAKQMASVILFNCPDSPNRRIALRKIREVAMTANASIGLLGRA